MNDWFTEENIQSSIKQADAGEFLQLMLAKYFQKKIFGFYIYYHYNCTKCGLSWDHADMNNNIGIIDLTNCLILFPPKLSDSKEIELEKIIEFDFNKKELLENYICSCKYKNTSFKEKKVIKLRENQKYLFIIINRTQSKKQKGKMVPSHKKMKFHLRIPKKLKANLFSIVSNEQSFLHLVGILCHFGKSIHMGHYVLDLLINTQQSGKIEIFRFNDYKINRNILLERELEKNEYLSSSDFAILLYSLN